MQKHFSERPSESAAVLAALGHPFTFRLPAPTKQDPYFGCSRTWWNDHVLPTKENGFKPPIRSIVDRRKGNVRGIRLIVYESARLYFERLAMEQEPKEGEGPVFVS